MPATSAAAITSLSRTDPPGWITAVAPTAIAASSPSANGKNASDAATLPRASGTSIPAAFAASSLFQAPIRALSTRLGCPAPIPTDEHLYHGDVPRWVAIRYGNLKYIRTLVEGEMEEMYNLESDPQELKNLAVVPYFRRSLSDLRSRCIGELRRTGAPFVDAMPRTKQMQSN